MRFRSTGPTLKDVADAAGVAIATASRSMNGVPGVHADTREKVLQAAAKLNYRPNLVARGLATGRSRSIGLLVSDLRNPFFAEVARGAEDAATAAGYEVILCNSDLDADKQQRYARTLLEKRVEGLVINPVSAPTPTEQDGLEELGLPVVLLAKPGRARPFSSVTVDNFQGGMLAGEYLVKLGHRRVAVLTGPQHHRNLTERLQGFTKATSAAEPAVEVVVVHGDHTFQGGQAMAKELFAKRKDLTAVFTANDATAFGVLRAAHERGMRVPDDLSLVGFDNVDLCEVLWPPLTSIHQPKYDIGRAAVEILLQLAASTGIRTQQHRVLGVQLVERQSCRAIAA